MLALLALGLIGQMGPAPILRDTYGVPHILASSWGEAFFYAGKAVAEDRLWQMELSRRLAKGRLAEVFGPEFAASDQEVLRTSYTDAELGKQIDALGSRAKEALQQYAKGVNAYIAEAKAEGKLPEGFSKAGFQPEPWTPTDSTAIAVRLFQMFGRGGSGELRNLAALAYLKTQPCKDRYLDAFDDLAWQNDPSSPTTVPPEDDLPVAKRAVFPKFSRADTVSQLQKLPQLNLLELLPAIRISERAESTLVAQKIGVPYKVGSYAVVVGAKRSATGWPILLSAPQMGFARPSIVHEMSICGPGIAVAGIDVPGVPGVIIGHTPKLAWGLTSGVADLEDVFCLKGSGNDKYEFAGKTQSFQRISRTVKVKGGPTFDVVQNRTELGPVLFSVRQNGWHFARRSSFYGREMASYEVLLGLYNAASQSDVVKQAAKATMSFNLFYAATNGDTGFAYLGQVPVRAPGYDPRLPLPGDEGADWRGILPFDRMPQVANPAKGLLTNWNNKPAEWWPNLDSPVWGSVQHVSLLREGLAKPKLGESDVERAVWAIARRDERFGAFQPFVTEALAGAKLSGVEADAAAYLQGFDGWLLDGSVPAKVFAATLDELPGVLLSPQLGSFVSPDLMRMVAQPSMLLAGLNKTTSLDYLGGRKPGAVLLEAFKKAVAKLQESLGPNPAFWTFTPGFIGSTDPPVAYSNRGTYIQIVEMRPVPRARTVLAPGVAETGPHANDQSTLAATWRYKALGMRPGTVGE